MWHSVIPTDIVAGSKAYNIQPSVAIGQWKHAGAVIVVNRSRSPIQVLSGFDKV